MPKLTSRVPAYCKHKSSGQARCQIGGEDFLFGPYGSKASKVKYDQLINQWLANGRQLPRHLADELITITQLAVLYVKHCQKYYRKHGKQTDEVVTIKRVVKVVRKLYGTETVEAFGPLKLKAVRQSMVELGWCRKQINKHIGRVKRMFRWGVNEELIPGFVYQNIQAVDGLKLGRSEAVESDPVLPVPLEVVEETLAELNKIVTDMVRVQLLSGARPGEICNLRPADIDVNSDVWIYRPWTHKTEHHGRDRLIYIGPEAQEILQPYLNRAKSKFCFSPADADEQFRRAKRLARKTPLKYEKRITKKNPTRRPSHQYDTASYRKAIHRACDRAYRPDEKLTGEKLDTWRSRHRWSPNQLRHTCATEIRRQFGLEAAQVILGHAKADVTQVYAELHQERGIKIARQVG